MPGSKAQIRAWESQVSAVFIRHAIDNSGILTSPRHGERVAKQICQLAFTSLNGQVEEAEIISTALQLAEQGLSLKAASAMLRVLNQVDWLDTAEHKHLAQFQLYFLEKLAINREHAQQKSREHTQLALQQALHNQMEQQRRLHQAQEQHNKSLNEVLQLNARLVAITSETDLLLNATDGICQALNLADVTIYDYQPLETNWIVRTTTAVDIKIRQPAHSPVVELLKTAMLKQAMYYTNGH